MEVSTESPSTTEGAASDKRKPAAATLFVKNLPEDATKEQLELVFSEIGKLRHCFVVKKRQTEQVRGIGFVTFADESSAEAALKHTFRLGSNQLDVSIAEDRRKNKAAAKPKISFSKEAKEARRLQRAKLIVRNLSFKATEADLEQIFGKHGKIAQVNIPKKDDGQARGFAFVQFSKVPEAMQAIKSLNAKPILGRPVAVDFAVAKSKFEEVRRARKLEGTDAKKNSSPSKNGGDAVLHESVGKSQDERKSKALGVKRTAPASKNSDDSDQSEGSQSDESSDSEDESSSGEDARVPSGNRQTAKIDQRAKKRKTSQNGEVGSRPGAPKKGQQQSDESDSEVEFGSDGEVRIVKFSQVKDKSRVLRRVRSGDVSSDNEEDDDDDSEGLDEDSSEDSQESDAEEQDEDSAMEVEEDDKVGKEVADRTKGNNKDASNVSAKGRSKPKAEEADSDSDWGHTPNDDSSEDEDENATDEIRERARRKAEMIKNEDLNRTVFVKNISFDTTQKTFQEHMKRFGPYKFCLLCMDKVLDRPKGTGFVKFEERDDAARCVQSLQAGEMVLDGKILQGSIAIKRDQVQEEVRKKLDSKKQPHDKRNLYLAREGFIRGGTSAGTQISDHDLKLRAKLEANKKKALKNLHNFVSQTRLCIHNLPPSCDDKQLRRIFASVVPRSAKITEARVMRNLKRLGHDGKGVSKGFGFVNFERHEDALMALRAVNNNPTIFTDQMRPVVSFSIENKAALMVKERRLNMSRQKLRELNQIKSASSSHADGQEIDYSSGTKLPFEGLRAQVDMTSLPKRVGEKIRLDPKRRQRQIKIRQLARKVKKAPEFRRKKEKKIRGPTKAQLKEREGEQKLNRVIAEHRRKMHHRVES